MCSLFIFWIRRDWVNAITFKKSHCALSCANPASVVRCPFRAEHQVVVRSMCRRVQQTPMTVLAKKIQRGSAQDFGENSALEQNWQWYLHLVQHVELDGECPFGTGVSSDAFQKSGFGFARNADDAIQTKARIQVTIPSNFILCALPESLTQTSSNLKPRKCLFSMQIFVVDSQRLSTIMTRGCRICLHQPCWSGPLSFFKTVV